MNITDNISEKILSRILFDVILFKKMNFYSFITFFKKVIDNVASVEKYIF